MRVAELKEALENLPDDCQVLTPSLHLPKRRHGWRRGFKVDTRYRYRPVNAFAMPVSYDEKLEGYYELEGKPDEELVCVLVLT